jgi:hypothetical protein
VGSQGTGGLHTEPGRYAGDQNGFADIRQDVDPNDLLRALVGFTYGNASPGWQASALRLIDILMDGLRSPRAVD